MSHRLNDFMIDCTRPDQGVAGGSPSRQDGGTEDRVLRRPSGPRHGASRDKDRGAAPDGGGLSACGPPVSTMAHGSRGRADPRGIFAIWGLRMTILDEIVASKRLEVAAARRRMPLEELEAQAAE